MPLDPLAEAPSTAETPTPEPARDVEPMELPMAVNVRSASLAVVAVLASVFILHWASTVFIPLLLGLMLSYALSPAVARLERWRLPRALGATVVLSVAVFSVGSLLYSLSDDATAVIESLPDAAQKLGESVRPRPGAPEGAIDKVQRAAAQLEQAAEDAGTVASPPAARGVTRVQIERQRFDIKDYLWTSTIGLAGLALQAMVVFFITFFLLVSGDSFRRKMVRIAGPSFSQKKVTVQALDEITGQIQRYLMIQAGTCAAVGLATWAAMAWIGLERAAVWGLVAAVLNLVPYLGSAVTAGGLALVGFLQFGTPGMALLIGGVSLLINTIEGNLLTPWLTGRASRMSPVVIFVGVLAFGWLWGVWGLFLGPPLLMVIKVVCDRIDDLKTIGELLGE